MKTCITSIEATRIDKHLCAWKMAHAIQEDCIKSLAADMGVSQDTAHHWLECHEDARSLFDSIGTEIVPEEAVACTDASACYVHGGEPPRGWIFGMLLALFLMFVLVSVVCLVRVEM